MDSTWRALTVLTRSKSMAFQHTMVLITRQTECDSHNQALSVLTGVDGVDTSKVGILGHSYGGNTTMFQAALDERVRYACTSGAVCSFRNKIEWGTGIEMAEVLPGALDHFEIDDLLRLTAPRKLLVVSA